MSYADYDFYKSTYKGALPQAEFERLAERASDYIDGRTEYILQRSGIPPDLELRVKKCCCALADVFKENESGGVKSSESVDGYAVSYAVGTQRSAAQKSDDTLQLFLADLVRTVKWL